MAEIPGLRSYTERMHQRTWLSLITIPFVATLTYPVLVRQGLPAPRVENPIKSSDPLTGLSDIQDVLGLVRDNYVDAPNLEKVVFGGIQGVLERAHPLNAYLSPDDLRLPDPGSASLGMRLLKRGIYAHVVNVTAGSPAARAGVQIGDVIRKVDGMSVGSLSAWALERSLRGPEGSEVVLLRYASANGELKKLPLKREKVQRGELRLKKEARGSVLSVPDLEAGRGQELKASLENLDRNGLLVLDLRSCAGGSLAEAAAAAGCFGGEGLLATVQEAGRPDQPFSILPQRLAPFNRVAVLIGPGTLGAGEALAAALKKQGLAVVGERSAALGVERTRILLKQGGAVELVNKRWLGAGGERLAFNDRPSQGLRKPVNEKGEDLPGVIPSHPLKGVKPEDDLLGKVLEVLDKANKSKTASLGSVWLSSGLKRRDALVWDHEVI